jgi:hypothetical protein
MLRSKKSVMAAKLSRLTHKIAMQLHLVAESCAIYSSSSRRQVRKLLDTPSYHGILEFCFPTTQRCHMRILAFRLHLCRNYSPRCSEHGRNSAKMNNSAMLEVLNPVDSTRMPHRNNHLYLLLSAATARCRTDPNTAVRLPARREASCHLPPH